MSKSPKDLTSYVPSTIITGKQAENILAALVDSHRIDPLLGWSIYTSPIWCWSNMLDLSTFVQPISPALKDVYQFGVATGTGLRLIGRKMKEANIPVESYHGFDVFTGMPEEENEPIFELNWSGGPFNELARRGLDSVEGVAKALVQEWEAENPGCTLYIYAGLFKHSLPFLNEEGKDLLGRMHPALVVHIDCDLYTSTIEALDFMYSNNLIQAGTMIIYDDWGGTKSWQQAHSGESRAHKEMTIKYSVSYHHCYQFGISHPDNNCPENIQRAYIVSSVGDEPTLDSEIGGTIIGSFKNTLVNVDSDVPYTPKPWPKGY